MKWPVDYRALATELVVLACNDAHGRPESDPLYQAVTEGRDRPPYPNRYSSCGDLAHWLLYRLGVRLPLVNRAEHLGFTYGVNVSRLAFDPLAIKEPPASARFHPGDIGIIWSKPDTTDAHVFVFLDDQQPQALLVAEFGQPGGRVNTRRVGYAHGLSIGGRRLMRVLRLNEVIDAADAAGHLAPPEAADMWTRRVLPELHQDTEPPPEAA